MKKSLLFLNVVLFTAIIFLTGCESATSIYKAVSDSYELSDDELEAFSEGRLSQNPNSVSDIDIDGGPGELDYSNADNLKQRAKSGVYILISGICSWTKHYGLIVAGVSAFVGIVIMRLARKSINIRRKALFILVIGIPLLMIVLLYGSAFLADSML